MQSQPPRPQFQPPQYPPQPQFRQPYWQPPIVPAAKPKRRLWLWALVGALCFLLMACVGISVIAACALRPHETAANPGDWTTIRTYHGTGDQRITAFDAPATWNIAWTCTLP